MKPKIKVNPLRHTLIYSWFLHLTFDFRSLYSCQSLLISTLDVNQCCLVMSYILWRHCFLLFWQIPNLRRPDILYTYNETRDGENICNLFSGSYAISLVLLWCLPFKEIELSNRCCLCDNCSSDILWNTLYAAKRVNENSIK